MLVKSRLRLHVFMMSFLSDFDDILDDSFDAGLTQVLQIPTQNLLNVNFDKRFGAQRESVKNENEFKEGLYARIPANTRRSTQTAVTTYNSWRAWRQIKPETFADSHYPIPSLGPDMTKEIDLSKWDYWLAR